MFFSGRFVHCYNRIANNPTHDIRYGKKGPKAVFLHVAKCVDTVNSHGTEELFGFNAYSRRGSTVIISPRSQSCLCPGVLFL
ncbi:hypothetical protein XSR1_350046 [Xenorhabdus szentirmaii DSM 16338]|uniref:Uncharacterized protein n=1 Tax=Xenorhabdus szentirmaii DSM 16338 TaxID=1427518 RepID=W1IZ24_9GAMM|nr:hypothetical protein XSR1_350046 [Xenorhabdus szentirmaii DSM 16338]